MRPNTEREFHECSNSPGEIVDKLLHARADYAASGNDYYDEVLDEVSAQIDAQGSVGKTDIAALVCWKRLNASTRWVSQLMQMPDSEVRRCTKNAVEHARSTNPIDVAVREAIKAMEIIPGLKSGKAVASAVLTAAAPLRMAVYDRRVHASMNDLGIRLGSGAGLYPRYMRSVDQIRALVNAAGETWIARDVDIALYWMQAKRVER